MIAVDVQVIDREGVPVTGLGPEKFEVTINGRRRRVLSADLIESRSALTLTPAERATAASGRPASSRRFPRVVVIAIDCLSFDASASRARPGGRPRLHRSPAGDRRSGTVCLSLRTEAQSDDRSRGGQPRADDRHGTARHAVASVPPAAVRDRRSDRRPVAARINEARRCWRPVARRECGTRSKRPAGSV